MPVQFIGDSHLGGLAGRIRQVLPDAAISYQNGTHTAQWVNFNLLGDPVVVVLGTNDTSKGRPASETAQAARQIVARAGGRRVLWALPPLYNRGAATLNAIRQSGAEILESPQLPLQSDGWHSTPQGYQWWADMIVSRLGALERAQPNVAGAVSLQGGNSPSLLILLLVLTLIKIARS